MVLGNETYLVLGNKTDLVLGNETGMVLGYKTAMVQGLTYSLGFKVSSLILTSSPPLLAQAPGQTWLWVMRSSNAMANGAMCAAVASRF